MVAIARKRRTNVTIESKLLDEARLLDLNVSAIASSALTVAVREARAQAWSAQNAQALAQRRAWIETNGLPLAAWQAWKLE